jgi:hypothetical protein
MSAKKLLAGVCVMGAMGALLWAQADKGEPSGAQMAQAAEEFLRTLTQDQAKQATYRYEDPERINWHFIPRERKGLPLKQLEGAQLKAAQKLIRTGLSQSGYEQSQNVMSLEDVLYLFEKGDSAERRERRDPLKYYITIFGTPAKTGTWGWRVEGHHLSLNYTIEKGEVTASTPEFFGANPGRVDAPPNREVRILAPEEDIARQIIKLCSPDQKKKALIDEKAPGEIRSAGKAQPEGIEPVGIKYSDMSKDQQKLLGELLHEYLQNMPTDVGDRRREAINKAGMDNIQFAWWGEQEMYKPHDYRVQGPTFVIEYNNTQNDANHIHSVWRDIRGDFALPKP